MCNSCESVSIVLHRLNDFSGVEINRLDYVKQRLQRQNQDIIVMW